LGRIQPASSVDARPRPWAAAAIIASQSDSSGSSEELAMLLDRLQATIASGRTGEAGESDGVPPPTLLWPMGRALSEPDCWQG
jgi:hypothetical protein